MFTPTIGPSSLLREVFPTVEVARTFINRSHRGPVNWAIVPDVDGMVCVTTEPHALARGEQILASASLVEATFKKWFKQFKAAVMAVDPRYTPAMLQDRMIRATAWADFLAGKTLSEATALYAKYA